MQPRFDAAPLGGDCGRPSVRLAAALEVDNDDRRGPVLAGNA